MQNSIRAIANMSTTPDYSPEAIVQFMNRFALNEKSLALLMNVTPMTIRLWTADAAKPCGLSRRLLQIYELCPEIIDKLAAGGDEQ